MAAVGGPTESDSAGIAVQAAAATGSVSNLAEVLRRDGPASS